MPLSAAIERFVAPGMHLHFASTPSRANAALRALCRIYRHRNPRFTFSSSGFHSSAHLLGRLRLGARYSAAFYGDNYPQPRPNPLYSRLEAEGVDLEHLSVNTYLAALRAGAMGHDYEVTSSLFDSTLGDDLARRGRFASVAHPVDPHRRVGLVAAMRPDLTFVHVPACDATGHAVAALPFSEGPWGALAARRGVVVTTESIVDPHELARAPESLLLPAHRVLAVCLAPFGAHPQPLVPPMQLDVGGYPDDYDAYQLFREIGESDSAHTVLLDSVVLATDEDYRLHFGLGTATRNTTLARAPTQLSHLDALGQHPSEHECLTILAARRIAACVREHGYKVVLAGIGHSFFAARLAASALAREHMMIDVLVETGMSGIECGPASGPFLLGYDVIKNARRISSIDDVLGAVTCGSDNRCLGVLGAAQIDADGNINSTRLADGSLLVGSGGANDIASCAAEVVVLTSVSRERMVLRLPYVTSPGRAVRTVVTSAGVLVRRAPREPWHVEDVLAPPGAPPRQRLREVCPWPLVPDGDTLAAPISLDERRDLHALLAPMTARDINADTR